MAVEEKVMEDGAKSTKWVNGKGEEDHVALEDVANKSVAVSENASVRVRFADTPEHSLFVCLKM